MNTLNIKPIVFTIIHLISFFLLSFAIGMIGKMHVQKHTMQNKMINQMESYERLPMNGEMVATYDHQNGKISVTYNDTTGAIHTIKNFEFDEPGILDLQFRKQKKFNVLIYGDDTIYINFKNPCPIDVGVYTVEFYNRSGNTLDDNIIKWADNIDASNDFLSSGERAISFMYESTTNYYYKIKK